MIELRYREDMLILSRWLRQLVRLHLGQPIKVIMHYRLADGSEADLVLMDAKRSIEVELKETSARVFEQALARKRYFDYVYVAVDWPVSEILAYLAAKPEILEAGIGIVSTRDDIVVFRARKRPAPIARIIDYMRAGNDGR